MMLIKVDHSILLIAAIVNIRYIMNVGCVFIPNFRVKRKKCEIFGKYLTASGDLEVKNYLKDTIKKRVAQMNCTPFVRQYDILSNKRGVLLCQKECQTKGIQQNSKNM